MCMYRWTRRTDKHYVVRRSSLFGEYEACEGEATVDGCELVMMRATAIPAMETPAMETPSMANHATMTQNGCDHEIIDSERHMDSPQAC